MTATVDQTETAAAVTTWLTAFGAALAAGDAAAAAELFVPDCYWRDLIAFTWNVKTLEGRDAIAGMLGETLPEVRPGNWKITDGEEPADAGGVIEAWIEFETAAGRGCGHLLRRIRARTRTGGRRASSSGPTTRPSISAARYGRTART
jgi:hypothetical protein